MRTELEGINMTLVIKNLQSLGEDTICNDSGVVLLYVTKALVLLNEAG